MIPKLVVIIIKEKIIESYIKEYAKIGVEIVREGFTGYFDEYHNNNMIGDTDCFIVYNEIGDKSCTVVDVLSTTGKIYELWGQLVTKYDTILAQAFDTLPIVKRAYKKLGGVGTGIYNNCGQQIYLFKRS